MAIKVEYVGIDSIKPYENNARKHEQKDVKAIIKSIEEFGFNDPIGVLNGEIVEGHGRLMAAKELGMTEIPIIRLDDLTDEQRRAYALAHNKTAELSDWDFDVLASELQDINDIDMAEFGFNVPSAEGYEMAAEPEELFEDVEKLESHYGVPYQGNKSRIADIIIKLLPKGNRLVDLFGGGGVPLHIAPCSQINGTSFCTMI